MHSCIRTTPPANKRSKHASNFNRKADGSFYKLEINKNIQSRPTSTEQERTCTFEVQPGAGLFSARQGLRGRSSEFFYVETLNAKRWVHNLEFCLVQWIGYRELTCPQEEDADEQSCPRAVALVSLTNVHLAL
ncbi:hypothetical protein PHMEG_00014071 [Phytophthora megakarya]|uniref:Uncharacterized protein n=1 Tax=Phytophthora megakarya TaxID=4795 RepID=A0A225W4W0_9STRA|nr:hypothetical protein PHMEG_00014071 [Phytophthora megakarya]